MARQTVSIEWLLDWTYRVQRADLYGGGTSVAHAGDGTFEIGRDGPRGAKMSGGTGGAFAAIDEDAIAVHSVVALVLAPRTADLVIRLGRTGSRPDWKPNARFRFVPCERHPSGLGRSEKVLDKTLHTWVHYTPVTTLDDPETIAMHRRLYNTWHAALQSVRVHLVNRDRGLAAFRVSQAMPPASPWDDPAELSAALTKLRA